MTLAKGAEKFVADLEQSERPAERVLAALIRREIGRRPPPPGKGRRARGNADWTPVFVEVQRLITNGEAELPEDAARLFVQRGGRVPNDQRGDEGRQASYIAEKFRASSIPWAAVVTRGSRPVYMCPEVNMIGQEISDRYNDLVAADRLKDDLTDIATKVRQKIDELQEREGALMVAAAERSAPRK